MLKHFKKAVLFFLGTYEKFAGDLATVTGWGFTFPGRNSSGHLQDVDITVATNEDCRNSLGAGTWPIREYYLLFALSS